MRVEPVIVASPGGGPGRRPRTPSGTQRERRWDARLGADVGSATVEMAVLFPVLLVLVLTVVQAGMWWHTRNITLAAAHAGLAVARTTTGTAPAARAAAESYLERAGGGAVSEPTVQASVTTDAARVEVTATAPRVLPVPGLEIRVGQAAEARREVFTIPGGPG